MGIEIDRSEFHAADFRAFEARLRHQLGQLEALLKDPEFGRGPASLGSELELYTVDRAGRPMPVNQEIHAAASDPQLTLELNRYNLEYNLTPQLVTDGAFNGTEQEIVARLGVLQDLAEQFDARVVPIGILPTLRESDFGPECVTDRVRYHALVRQLIRRRGSNFRIDINGQHPLQTAMADITLEGANTSFQVHYRVNPADYADTFNAVQLVTPLVVAIAANSPTLFGHSLWRETRIPLFKQSIDTRQPDRYRWSEPARVNFGRGWVRHSAYELFAETVRLYTPLLPVCSAADEDSQRVPALDELRLHLSTVWLWNRPIYDPAGDGHLRIEMRALPAGPTAIDMAANAALLIGLAEGLRPEINELLPSLPFHIAEYNFYRAAQHGLDAQLVWPDAKQHGLSETPVVELIATLLPVARRGLAAIGTPQAEIDRYIDVIAQRLDRRRTGASWQLDTLHRLGGGMHSPQALHEMLELFMRHSARNTPVADWPL